MKIKFNLTNYRNNFEKYQNVKSKLIIDFCEKVQPEMSIMIPTFKRPGLIKQTIDSAIKQVSEIEFEVVIIDNDPDCQYSKELEMLVRSYNRSNIRYFRNDKNIGMFGNWNRCIELARGKWLTILNDDDCLKSDFISATYKLKDKNGLVCVDFTDEDSSEGINTLLNKPSFSISSNDVQRLKLSEFFWRNPINGSLGALFERDKAKEIGGYDDALYPISDYYFTLCYWNRFGGHKIKAKLAIYRWGMNESLKVETLMGFLKNCHKLRIDLIEQLMVEKTFLKSLYISISKLLTIRAGFAYKKVNSNFDLDKALNYSDVCTSRMGYLLVNPVSAIIAKIIVRALDYELVKRYYFKARIANE
ncbi:glycosyltransferase [Porticoccaceae bacterium]|nr:glycosyltransferase [Porticoccaceae bacterium]